MIVIPRISKILFSFCCVHSSSFSCLFSNKINNVSSLSTRLQNFPSGDKDKTSNMKYLTKEQALQKLKHYCTYQERSHYEVKQKLYELGVRSSDHDEIIASLIDED